MKRVIVASILVFFILAVASSVLCEENQEFVLITDKAVVLDLQGDVDVEIYPSAPWRDVEVGMVLKKDSKLRTAAGSWVEVGFELGIGNENVIRVQEESFVEFTNIQPVRLGLLRGELRSLVQSLRGNSTYEIKTPTAVCGARGTGWDTSTDGSKVIVDTYEEEVYFYEVAEDGEPIVDPIIKAGKRGILKGPKVPIDITNLPPGKQDDWNKWKDDMSNRTGIKVGLKGKVDKMNKTQKTIKDLMKGKEKALERKDIDTIKDRLDDKSDSRQSDGDSEKYTIED